MRGQSRPIRELVLTASFVLVAASFDGLMARASEKDNSIESATLVGSGVFIQSFMMTRHFYKSADEDDSPFLKKRLDQEPERRKPEEPTDLSWNLGYSYDNLSSPPTAVDASVMDETHSFSLGLDWTPLPELDLSSRMYVDFMGAENYKSGHFVFHLEYMFSMEPEDEDAKKERLKREASAWDAKEYYKPFQDKYRPAKKEEKAEEVYLGDDDEDSREEDSDPYPNLKVALNLGFSRHLKGPLQFIRTTRPVQLGGDIYLNQFSTGAEAIFALNDLLSFRTSAALYRYTGDVDAFVTYFDQLPSVMGGLTTTTGIASHVAQLLTFPGFVLEQSIEYDLGEVGTLELNINETWFAPAVYPWAFTANPLFYRSFGKNWRAGLGVNVSFQGLNTVASGTLGLIYYL